MKLRYLIGLPCILSLVAVSCSEDKKASPAAPKANVSGFGSNMNIGEPGWDKAIEALNAIVYKSGKFDNQIDAERFRVRQVQKKMGPCNQMQFVFDVSYCIQCACEPEKLSGRTDELITIERRMEGNDAKWSLVNSSGSDLEKSCTKMDEGWKVESLSARDLEVVNAVTYVRDEFDDVASKDGRRVEGVSQKVDACGRAQFVVHFADYEMQEGRDACCQVVETSVRTGQEDFTITRVTTGVCSTYRVEEPVECKQPEPCKDPCEVKDPCAEKDPCAVEATPCCVEEVTPCCNN